MSEGGFSQVESELEIRAKIFEKALRLLSRREHASKELKQKLELKGCDSALVDRIVDELRDNNYLSDQRYQEMRTRHLIKQGFGFTRIQSDLSRFGLSVTKEQYQSELEDLSVDLESQIDELIEKALRQRKFDSSDERYRFRTKLCQKLLGRGFSLDQVRDRVWKLTDDRMD